jgi:hypothetical protein
MGEAASSVMTVDCSTFSMQGAAGDQQGAVYFYQETPDPRSQPQQPAGDSVVWH